MTSEAPRPRRRLAPKRLPLDRDATGALRAQAAEAARRGRRQVLLLTPLVIALLAIFTYRRELFGLDREVRIAAAVALVVLGWGIARGLGRLVAPLATQRLGASAAGISGWVVRLIALVFTVLVSLRIAGLEIGTLALGASFTAIVFGLGAQQTFGNVIAGLVLLSARPFSIGDRVRFNGFGMDVEGTVAAHGLLYITMHDGEDLVLVPNTTALTMSVRPIREPSAVDMRARLPLGTDPELVQQRVVETVTVPTRGNPHIVLEEFDGEEIVFRVKATPSDPAQGAALAREVLEAILELDGVTERREREAAEAAAAGGEAPFG